ncbi:AEC family transporter [Desulfobulbus oligotrophicus]|uniref:AEC family transporter n=1 Tax=Desulfobulbus oligotrophicus TaxID=1909699 RepID=A0A7T5VBC2_9BACT|nr:AEC family transporter [Desulfobulbus oligotrophicus]QQG64759.1 AEC family transporter [Desulfobulbus oligotrophicus]
MDNFLLILFFVGLGWLFRHIKAFPGQTAQVLNLFVLYVALPAVILLKIPQLNISTDMIVPIAVAWSMLPFSVLLILLGARRYKWSRETIGVLLLVIPVGNTSFMGLPMVNAFFGEAGIPYLIMYDQLGTLLIFVTYGSVILAIYGSRGQVRYAQIVRQALLFPPTIALVLGLALRSWEYPDLLVRQLQIMADMLTPLVMVAIGFQLNIRISSGVLYPLGFGLVVKMALAPIFALAGCHILGLKGLATEIAIFEAGMPPMVTAGAVAIAADMHPELAAALVSLGLALAFVTLPALYWLI